MPIILIGGLIRTNFLQSEGSSELIVRGDNRNQLPSPSHTTSHPAHPARKSESETYRVRESESESQRVTKSESHRVRVRELGSQSQRDRFSVDTETKKC